jgi:hypothetical protein
MGKKMIKLSLAAIGLSILLLAGLIADRAYAEGGGSDILHVLSAADSSPYTFFESNETIFHLNYSDFPGEEPLQNSRHQERFDDLKYFETDKASGMDKLMDIHLAKLLVQAYQKIDQTYNFLPGIQVNQKSVALTLQFEF